MISSVSNAGPGSHSQARAQQLAIRGDPVSPCRTTNGCNMPSRWQHVRRDAFATRQDSGIVHVWRRRNIR